MKRLPLPSLLLGLLACQPFAAVAGLLTFEDVALPGHTSVAVRQIGEYEFRDPLDGVTDAQGMHVTNAAWTYPSKHLWGEAPKVMSFASGSRFFRTDGSTFNMESAFFGVYAEFASAYPNSAGVSVIGLLDGAEKYSLQLAPGSGSGRYQLGWTGVDEVTFRTNGIVNG